jgi:SNF2 family DNA or RNA helicase
MHHTIEEKMMALKEAKQKLLNDVMENTENKKTSLMSKKDFDLLLN